MARRRLAAKARRKQQQSDGTDELEAGAAAPAQDQSDSYKSEPALVVLALSQNAAALAAGQCIHLLQERYTPGCSSHLFNASEHMRI